jgi:hypothetical protein
MVPALAAVAAVAAAAAWVGLGIRGASREAGAALAAAGEARAFCARASVDARLEATRAAALAGELERQLHDARLLAALGYQPHGRARRVSMRVGCDGGAYLPGSNGEAAWRALRETGLCDPAEPVPAPEASPAAGVMLH